MELGIGGVGVRGGWRGWGSGFRRGAGGGGSGGGGFRGIPDGAHHDSEAFDGDHAHRGTAEHHGAFRDHVNAASVDGGGSRGTEVGEGGAFAADQFGFLVAQPPDPAVGDEPPAEPAPGEVAEPDEEPGHQGAEGDDQGDVAPDGAQVAVGEDHARAEAHHAGDPGHHAGKEHLQGHEDQAREEERQDGRHDRRG